MKSLSARQRFVERVEHFLETRDVGVIDHRHARNAQLAAEIEQIVLRLRQHFADAVGDIAGQHDADRAVELVDGAVRGDARRILGHARAVAEAGRAVVAGLRIDLGKTITHSDRFFSPPLQGEGWVGMVFSSALSHATTRVRVDSRSAAQRSVPATSVRRHATPPQCRHTSHSCADTADTSRQDSRASRQNCASCRPVSQVSLSQ